MLLFQKTPHYPSYSVLGRDFHSHLLPGIDDGAKTMEDSLSLIRQMMELGFSQITTTPHINSEYYPNTREIILGKLEEVRAALREHQIPLELHAAAEYYLDDHFEGLLASGEPLLTVWDNFVLVEMSFFGAPPKLEEYIFRLRTKGYAPILAHPERYGFLHQDFGKYQRLKDLGCRFQLNILSLSGYYDRPVQQAAEKLVRLGMADYLCTDLHHQRHLDHLREALESKGVRKAMSKVSG
ncbi:MAG: hypothetical protein IPN74_19065 [Haliscomenobacter sp.]|nr:hypothetical protein [Haliscomenobacter sp.]